MIFLKSIKSNSSISSEDSVDLVLWERDTNRFQSSGQHLAFRQAEGGS